MRPEKPIVVEHIQNLLDESENFLLVSYMGMSVKKQEELKGLLKEQNAQFQVHKNKLIKKAAEGKSYAGLADLELTGGTAVVYGEGETPQWAKVIKKFAKENEEVSFKAAFHSNNTDNSGLNSKSIPKKIFGSSSPSAVSKKL